MRLILALAVSCIAFILTDRSSRVSAVQAIAVWNVFAWSVIFLAWSRIILADARTSVQTAKLQDTARSVIFLFVIFAAVMSLSAVAILVGGAKGMGHKALTEHLLLAGYHGSFLLVPYPYSVYDALRPRVLSRRRR